ncbi:MAG: TRAP transporter small permease subunit [Ignavibacteria bacterium]|jgi:TRAP-type mannitol/chloroaromatic compound transport system permease small subunit
MNIIINIIDTANEKIGRAVSWLSFTLVLVVCYDVFTRYFLKVSSVAVQELEWHLFSVLFLLSAAYTLKHDDHVRVDIFYSKLNERNKAIVNIIGSLLLLIPFCLMVIFTSKNFVYSSFQISEISPDPGGLPARFVLKSFVPVSFIFLFLQGIGLFLKSFVTLKKKTKPD